MVGGFGMIVINDRRVVISNENEFRDVLEGDYSYSYIYLNGDIEITSDIYLNGDKDEFIIDGTYLNNRYTLTLGSDYGISANYENKRVVVKNINIVSSNVNGVIYTPGESKYKVEVEYNNITFNGVRLSFNPYGKTKIIDCNINVSSSGEIDGKDVCQSDHIVIGGRTTIEIESSATQMFTFSNNFPTFTVLAGSRVDISNDVMAFMNGTNRLDFNVLRGAEFNLITGNGFTAYSTHGVRNVFIDESAVFIFFEKAHQRVPMWNIFGNLKISDGATFHVINTYASTPDDNYNLYFRGNNQNMIFDNPKSVILYSKNSPGIFASGRVNFTINVSRINMWSDSADITVAGSLDTLPLYSWYKENGLMYLSGNFSKDNTSVTTSNLTSEELAKLPLMENFIWTGKKMLSMGNSYINIDPIDGSSNKIKGYTVENSDVLIEYGDSSVEVYADSTGLFEYVLPSNLTDGTEVMLTSNVGTSFIYTTRNITVPFDGELSLVKANDIITFSLEPLSDTSIILPRKEELLIKVIDSRLVSSKWTLYVQLSGPMTSDNGFVLATAVIFKGIDEVETSLNEVPTLVFTGQNNGGNTLVTDVTWSREKGILLNLVDSFLEVNEEYSTKVIWSIME